MNQCHDWSWPLAMPSDDSTWFGQPSCRLSRPCSTGVVWMRIPRHVFYRLDGWPVAGWGWNLLDSVSIVLPQPPMESPQMEPCSDIWPSLVICPDILAVSNQRMWFCKPSYSGTFVVKIEPSLYIAGGESLSNNRWLVDYLGVPLFGKVFKWANWDCNWDKHSMRSDCKIILLQNA